MSLVEVKNNQVVTTSRQVAECFSKQHRNVIRAIQNLVEGVLKIEHTPQMFFLTSYTNEQNGQEYPEYYMNRDGFSLLVMGFTGQKAIEWKIKYIEAFNQMEEELKKQQTAALPVATFTRCFWNGEIVIPAMYLSRMTSISEYRIRYLAQQVKGEYIVLKGEILNAFKRANGGVGKQAKNIAIFPRYMAEAILKLAGVYETFKRAIDEYFQTSAALPPAPRELPPASTAYADIPGDATIQMWIAKIEASIQETSKLLKLYNQRNTPENRETYDYYLRKAAADTYAQLCMLKQFDVKVVNA